LAPAVARTGGRLNLDQVFAYLQAGHYQLWRIAEAAMVTEIRTYPTMLRTLNVLLLGGHDWSRWWHLWPQIERWALARGCSRAEFSGRRGWARALKGWKETTIDMEKDLCDGQGR
jgi:hypothetical protein